MRFALVPILLLAGAVHAGSIHKWVDEDGNVHYGDAPPVSAKTENVRVLSAPSNPGRALPRLGGSGGDENAAAGTAAAASDDTVPADQARIACEQAQEDLAVINRSSRIKLRGADGSERFLSTEEIAERKQRAEADIDRFCD
ncbi:MAG: DUF4124 domain-containing protein [Gammaproteobacteria bacterium]|nr:DUF4124 domain-containing protein [Gammaproteobacteria bacterium]